MAPYRILLMGADRQARASPRFAGLTYPHRACFPEFGRVLDCPANRPTKIMSMIPAGKMIVLWDTNDKQQITKLAVEHISHQPASTHALPDSAGSCTMGWLGDNPIDNPIGLFSYLAASHGFQDRQTAMHALRQFSKVEGQSWVKEILRRSGELDEDEEDE